MSNSSQPKNSSNNLFNDVFISGGSDSYTITIPSDTMNATNYVDDLVTITLPGSSYTTLSDTITLNTNYEFNWGDAEEWVDAFPDWQRIQDMCQKYPGLEIALRNFRTVYTLVKDDYDNPKDEN